MQLRQTFVKEESRRVYTDDDEHLSGQLNAGFSKVHNMSKSFHRESVIVATFPRP